MLKNTPNSGETTELIRKYIEARCSEQELRKILSLFRYGQIEEAFNEAARTQWELLNAEQERDSETSEAAYRQEALQILARNKKTARYRKLRNYTIWAAAAMVMVGLIVEFAFQSRHAEAPVAYVEYTVAKGETRNIILPDGSKVALNAMSTLKHAEHWKKGEPREVQLNGEAYFEVVPQNGNPFSVKANDIDVRVVGTTFNVSSYMEDQFASVTVVEGCVNVECPSQGATIRVVGSERLSFDRFTNGMEKSIEEAQSSHLWRDGYLSFYNMPISEVVKELKRYYSQDIKLANTTSRSRISGVHDNRSFEAVLESVCFTAGLRFKKEGETYILY